MILTVNDLQVDSYENNKVLIEKPLANLIPLKEVVECVVNNEKVHLTNGDLTLSNTKTETWFMHQNKWLAAICIASFIIVVSFDIDIIMAKKWYIIRNTIVTISTSVRKVAKQLAGALSLLNLIRGGGAIDISESQNKCVIRIGMTGLAFLS